MLGLLRVDVFAGSGGRKKRFSGLVLAAACIVLIPLPNWAQTTDEINAGLQFSFSPPGARSMALGNAFVGLADDATAAYANPAGLLWLRRPEASIELRRSDFKTRYPNLGSATGTPSFCSGEKWFESSEGCLDTLEGLEFSEFDSRVDSASFLSYVHLFKKKKRPSEAQPYLAQEYLERWRLAFYRHELANFRAEIDRSEGAFVAGQDTAQQFARSRLSAVAGRLDLQISSMGVAGAYALRRTLWLGLSVSHYSFNLDSITRRYRTINAFNQFAALPGPADFSAANETDQHRQDGSDSEIAVTIGLLWKNRGVTPRWSAGVVYRQAPVFSFDYLFEYRDRALLEAQEGGNPNKADPGHATALSGQGEFETPDYLSAGFMYSLIPDILRITFEYAHVGYSTLKPESNVLLNVLQGSGNSCGDFDGSGEPLNPPVSCTDDPDRLGRFTVDDVNEFHLGLEYQIRSYPKLILRAGAWLDPDHQMRYELPAELNRLEAPEDRFAPRFAPGEDELHLTGGFGLVPLGERYQIDLAFDLSDRADIASLSAVLRWR